VTTEPVRAAPDWLALREPADATARSDDLVEELRPFLSGGESEIRDLGCGTGSMARWLAPRLPGRQHWVLYDRDAELLALAESYSPAAAVDGSPVSVETRERDITRLEPAELTGASLIPASALLDMLTAPELDRLVTSCVRADCPALFTLTVTGRVDLEPEDPMDRPFGAAFNDHQRRPAAEGRRLGPDAVDAAVDFFTRAGLDVLLRPSPWRLGSERSSLTTQWLAGWLTAACEQRPELEAERSGYARRRLDQLAEGRLSVAVHHQDLLVLPA
jgi:SAM-dependent methyltransferase